MVSADHKNYLIDSKKQGEREDALCIKAMTEEGCKTVDLSAEEREVFFQKASAEEVSVTRLQFSDELIALSLIHI